MSRKNGLVCKSFSRYMTTRLANCADRLPPIAVPVVCLSMLEWKANASLHRSSKPNYDSTSLKEKDRKLGLLVLVPKKSRGLRLFLWMSKEAVGPRCKASVTRSKKNWIATEMSSRGILKTSLPNQALWVGLCILLRARP